MRIQQFLPDGTIAHHDSLKPILDGLEKSKVYLHTRKASDLLDYFDIAGEQLLKNPFTQRMDGVMFLSSWLKRKHMEEVVKRSLGNDPIILDEFIPIGTRRFLTAKPQGTVCMWMAGNVVTLPMFSFIPSLITKNVTLLKLADGNATEMHAVLALLASIKTETVDGAELMKSLAVIWFDYTDRSINEAMSLAADAKVMWGGEAAIKGITSLPRYEHCKEIVYGPKYSFGVISRNHIESATGLDSTVTAFIRDSAIFDQRGCSSPQIVFIEKNNKYTLKELAEKFAAAYRRLPPKPDLDAYTTVRIVNIRAEYALDPNRDVIASEDGANWTLLLDNTPELKEAIQSRTLYLTEVNSWHEIIPLINPKVQTIGIAFDTTEEALEFADAASLAGAVRCVRPGLMNVHDYPWDGKYLINELVRWIDVKH